MSIRYYLLLIAGITTTIVFLGSFFLESFLLNKSFNTAGKASTALYDQMFAKRKGYIEDFIRDDLVEKLSRVNAVLGAVSQYKPLAEWFSPSLENRQKGTWSNAASLIQQDEWIDFLQNTTQGELLSLIVPEKGPFPPIRAIPIEEGLAWVYVEEKDGSFTPFMGILVPNKLLDDQGEEGIGTFGILPTVYVLYDIKKLRAIDFSEKSGEEGLASAYVPIPYAQGIEIDEKAFLLFLSRAMDLVHASHLQIPVWTEKQGQENLEKKENSFQKEVKKALDRRSAYGSELFLIWEAAVLRQLGAFGIKEFRWPDAMTFSGQGEGQVFFLEPVMAFSSPIFDDVSFFASHAPNELDSSVSSGSTVLKGLKGNQVFLANTAAFFEEDGGGERKQSLLTVGVNLNELLENIVLTSQCFGLIFSGGKVLINKAPDGKDLFAPPNVNGLLEEQMGVGEGDLVVEGVEYHFFRMQPDPSLDLSFFLFNPKRDAFDFSYNFQVFQDQMKELIEQLDIDRRLLEGVGILILWLLLLRLSKQITRPIVALSSALQYVKKGAWDQIQIPKIEFRKHNEIKLLCDSFADMVEGMKEKEKVTGILNKVVSPEIAKEILRGDISLGGEERVVTMLFVDIRGFTKMTQNMPPQEVIALLNTCMTKLSAIVEEHKGVIDKYTGDGLMALYGAPVSYADHALQAIFSGLAMLQAMRAWNEERREKELCSISIGIGIHTGSVCAGNMGAQDRLNYTVIGRHVNLASRLCAAAEPEGILITEDTYEQERVKESITVEDKGLMDFKGFDAKQHVLSVIGKQEASLNLR